MRTAAPRSSAASWMSTVVHQLVGSRDNSAASSSESPFPLSKQHGPPSNYGHMLDSSLTLPSIAKQHQVVFCGEVHSRPPIIQLQQRLLQVMLQELSSPQTNDKNNDKDKQRKVHVVMEHFSLDMQEWLQAYQQGTLSFSELLEKYQTEGHEGHELRPYHPLLHTCLVNNQQCVLQAGFLPRPLSRLLVKEGVDAVRKELASKKNSFWLPPELDLKGSEFHYNVFESLITGRPLSSIDQPPTDQFRKIFPAQILKDVSMAHTISTILEKHPDDRILVIAGNGHLLYYCGVPERVLQYHPNIASCLIISQSMDTIPTSPTQVLEELERHFPKGSNPADYVYLYQDQWEDEEDLPLEEPEPSPTNLNNVDSESQNVKDETRQAYDQVGASAHLTGNAKRAQFIMTQMNYTQDQIEQIGRQDVYNFQGVGNPHLHAQIQKGDTVLDVGSGLGIDSFLAAAAATECGKVIGIDMSSKQVNHANRRAKQRGATNVEFIEADMETHIPLEDNSVDVVISNGAFCLAPHKERALREIYRVLKPGGHISICTTTTQVDDLEPGVSWPVCMKMFMSKKDIRPMCQRIGFETILVDDSDGSMSMEMPVELTEEANLNPDRNRIHVGGAEFSHLEDYDMDKLCQRVCIVATKPTASNHTPT